MPEGHTIHGLARDLARDFGGRSVHASSPQGRFADGAALIDGRTLDRSTAVGKHLFCEFGADILHVHLGLIGKFRPVDAETEPGDTVRLRLDSEGVERAAAWQLTGPQTCAVIEPDERDAVMAGLGPDPLAPGRPRSRGRADEFVRRFGSTRRPAGAALLDQGVVCGIGNVYRAELLFLVGTHPATPAADVAESVARQLWDDTCVQLKRGLAWDRIVTVDADDVGRRVTRRIDRDDALYVYHRTGEPCRRCQTPIEIMELAGRNTWFCPRCQPR